ncbi:MAG: hypothetical protein HC884_01830 [Chloroflexaceae bacterium]|nr:hypothetical protein [Chloroflexaceae bacterium]
MKHKVRYLLFFFSAVLAGALIAVGVQALNSSNQPQPEVALEDILPPTIINPDDPVPTVASLRLTIQPAPAMPTLPPGSPEPTAAPLPEAPEPAALAADETVRFANDFSTEPEDWTFGQISNIEVAAPKWFVLNDERIQEVLFAPENAGRMNVLNDTMAIPPTPLGDAGAVEVSARSSGASKLGLVVGYADEQNFTAMIFGTPDAGGIGSDGLMLVQMEDGSPKVLAYDPELVLERGHWYLLRLEVEGNTIQASVDGAPALTATLANSLAGQQAGLYASHDGFAIFDNLRFVGK